ncbi:MAG: hypothetical protein M9913_13350 [Bryobacteraceae bacterium]|nr:hypothetical protein [Solibacteraceae bacterium]MCO5351859.1 hypothetical protein [Bryobacteraceae bacterium]
MHTAIAPLFLSALLVTSAVISAQEVAHVKSVCEILENRSQLAGQIVAVRGLLLSDSMDSPHPQFDQITSEGCLAPDGAEVRVKLVVPDVHFLANPPAGFKLDLSSLRESERRLSKLLKAKPRSRKVIATVEGLLDVPAPSLGQERLSRRPAPKRFPAYITVQAIRSLEEVPAGIDAR